ncbi:MAG: S41 family peptidase, partial [bacterium]|nr:S41 family peptidase [bacterium]
MLKLDLVALVSPSFPSPHLVWHRKAGVRSGRWSIALLCLLWILGGCAVRTLPVEEAATPLTSETFRRTLDMYLYPDRLDRRVLVGSLDALESRFDSVRFDDDEENQQGILTVGEAKVTVPVAPTFEREQYRRVLARALHFVARNLREEIKPDETLELISLRGALNALDRYSTVFSGRSTDDFKIRFSGKLFGIGSQIGRRDGDLIAIHVFPDSPAERGGLKDGDAIITVDGDPTQPLSLHEAVDRIRGEVDTQIVLGVRRGEEKEELEITITRGEVVVPSVETKKLSDRIGYSRIFQVSRNTAVEFAEKTNALGNLDGLVLDLRGNTGGSMTAASHLADLFLSRQLILRVVNRDGEPASTRSRQIAGPEVLFPFKTVVLVDGSTASAAEILSGAMAPLGHVTIVGQTTFGKGLIQQVIPLPDENLLKLTVAEYLLSGDRAIHGKGIEPDIVLYPVPDKSLGELADVPENALPYIRISGEDDTFPIDFSQRMLEIGNEAAIAETRISANKSINEQLEDFGVVWRSASSQLPSELGAALEVSATGADLVAGESSVLTLEVHNPNSFPVPDTWIALRAPATYVQNQLVSLGTLPA